LLNSRRESAYLIDKAELQGLRADHDPTFRTRCDFLRRHISASGNTTNESVVGSYHHSLNLLALLGAKGAQGTAPGCVATALDDGSSNLSILDEAAKFYLAADYAYRTDQT